MNSEKIKSSIILEAIGRPKEHIVSYLGEVISQLEKENGIKVICKNIKEPVNIKDKPDFFTTFAEIDIETETIMHLMFIILKYMPAHIEVISPEKITFQNLEMGEILSELTRKLHAYDEVVRIVQAEKNILERKLKEMLPKDKSIENKEDSKKKKI